MHIELFKGEKRMKEEQRRGRAEERKRGRGKERKGKEKKEGEGERGWKERRVKESVGGGGVYQSVSDLVPAYLWNSFSLKAIWKTPNGAKFFLFLWQEHGAEGGLAQWGWDGTSPGRSPMWEKLAKAALSPAPDWVP